MIHMLHVTTMEGQRGIRQKGVFLSNIRYNLVEFKLELQNLVDKHFLQVFYGKKDEELLAQTDEQSNLTTPEPLVIHFTRPAPSFMEQGR